MNECIELFNRISELNKETFNATGRLIVREDNTFSYHLNNIKVRIESNDIILLLNRVIKYIENNRVSTYSKTSSKQYKLKTNLRWKKIKV